MLIERRSNLLNHTKKIGCNAIAVFQPENVFYLTGFWGEAIAIFADNSAKLIAPKLEATRALQISKECEIISSERGSSLISTLVSEIKGKTTCSDCNDFATIEYIQNKIGKKSFIINSEPFFHFRSIKDKYEIKTIANAAEIIDILFQVCTEEIKVGLSERDLQAKLIFEAMKMGATSPSYKSTLNPLIIAGGPNAAMPHSDISDRKFMKGDMIIVDLTLRYEGYIADATRTFALAPITSEEKKIYHIVRLSQQEGLDAIRDSSTCEQIDLACRDVIKKEGYSEHFIHSTGHGIGLDVHEPPWLRMKNQEMVRTNMTVTIEPGIYLEDKMGVRIEDSVLVNKDKKASNFNKFTKDLIILD